MTSVAEERTWRDTWRGRFALDLSQRRMYTARCFRVPMLGIKREAGENPARSRHCNRATLNTGFMDLR